MKKYLPFLIALSFALLLSCRPSHAATYNQAGFAQVNVGTSTAVTVTNPMGWQAGSTGAGAAGLNMGAAIPLTALPPSGNAVSPAVATAALGLIAGVPIAIGTAAVTPTITNPAAALAVAGGMMQTAGWMLAGTPAGIPLMAAGAAIGLVPAACAAVSGCQWLQAMAAQGVKLTPEGSVLKVGGGASSAPTNLYSCSSSYGYCPVASGYLSQYQGNACSAGGTATLNFTANKWVCSNVYVTRFQLAEVVNPVCSAGSSYNSASGLCGADAPATNADIVAAINATTGATNQAANTAAQNAAGADMINLALLGALNMSSLNYQTLQTQVASSFSELSKSTDNLGNTVQTLSRTVSTIPAQGPTPANVPFSPQISQQNQVVTVTNGTATQAVTNTATPPASLLSTTVPPAPTTDICAGHPEILACADITKLNDLPAVSAAAQTVDIGSMSPVTVGAPAICPPPFVLPGLMGGAPVTVDLWKDPCRFAVSIKPFTVALASMLSMFILIGAFKNG